MAYSSPTLALQLSSLCFREVESTLPYGLYAMALNHVFLTGLILPGAIFVLTLSSRHSGLPWIRELVPTSGCHAFCALCQEFPFPVAVHGLIRSLISPSDVSHASPVSCFLPHPSHSQSCHCVLLSQDLSLSEMFLFTCYLLFFFSSLEYELHASEALSVLLPAPSLGPRIVPGTYEVLKVLLESKTCSLWAFLFFYLKIN